MYSLNRILASPRAILDDKTSNEKARRGSIAREPLRKTASGEKQRTLPVVPRARTAAGNKVAPGDPGKNHLDAAVCCPRALDLFPKAARPHSGVYQVLYDVPYLGSSRYLP